MEKFITIDNYKIYVENGEYKKAFFKDSDNQEVCVELKKELQEEFKKRRREEFKEDYERRKHLDIFLKDDYIFETKTSNNRETLEEKIIDEDIKDSIIKAIWKLPTPQNKRVFMSVVNGYSYAKIARIEGVTETSAKSSILIGKEKLKKILKNF